MKHYGDITKIHGSDVPLVDIVCGGSPCQDLSIAGKRAGLAGERSGLFMEQIRIIKEMRDESAKRLRSGRTDVNLRLVKPRFLVWENVAGAFSSNKGRDFQAVLTEIVRIVRPDSPDVPLPDRGGWSKSGCLMGFGSDGQPFSVAYRLHDAQFWGVPQRRRRIALVADFGGTSAPEILFERESLSGNTAESREERKAIAGGVEKCVDSAISFLERSGKPGGVRESLLQEAEQEPCQPSIISTSCNSSGGDIAGALDSNYFKGCGERQGIEREVVCVSQDGYDKYSESEKAGAIKQSGGNIGGGVAKHL